MKTCRRWHEARETLKNNVKRHLQHHHYLQHLFANRDASKPLLSYLEATEIGKKNCRKGHGTSGGRETQCGDGDVRWNVLEEDPDEREREVEREQMANRLREAKVFTAGAVEKAEAAGVVIENR